LKKTHTSISFEPPGSGRSTAWATATGIAREAPGARGIIGVVDLVDCVQEHKSPLAMDGCYHWLLKNPRSLPFVPMPGRLGIFNVEVALSR
jgi:hypothetical protein